MARFEVLNGRETLFRTDCPVILRSFLNAPESYQPGLSEDVRRALRMLQDAVRDEAGEVLAGTVRLKQVRAVSEAQKGEGRR